MADYGIGATVHMGAGTRRLSMRGETWDLINLDRGQLSATAALLSDAKGLQPRNPSHKTKPKTKG